MESDFLSRREVARRLNQHPEYAQALIDVKGFKQTRVGSSHCISVADFQQLLPYRKARKARKTAAA